jgi:hypothetical protein
MEYKVPDIVVILDAFLAPVQRVHAIAPTRVSPIAPTRINIAPIRDSSSHRQASADRTDERQCDRTDK